MLFSYSMQFLLQVTYNALYATGFIVVKYVGILGKIKNQIMILKEFMAFMDLPI